MKILNLLMAAILVISLSFSLIACEKETTKEEEPEKPVVEEPAEPAETYHTTVNFESLDGLEITGDLYTIDETSPIILLFHRASWSRGEYREIAPKLMDLGFNVLAIDARSGSTINGIKNQTAARAVEQGLGTEYADAGQDIEATIIYATDELGYNDVITWGSSYSTVLVLAISQNYPEHVKSIVTYSPGGYFWYEDKNIMDHANTCEIPVYLTGAKTENVVYNAVFDNVKTENKVMFVPEVKGDHGSRVLWMSSKGNEEYWQSLTTYLEQFSNTN